MKGETLKYSIVNRKTLTGDEADLHELANLAGIVMDPSVFKIILDLLRLNVAPTAIERMLTTMTAQKKRHPPTPAGSGDDSASSHSSSSRSQHSTSRGRPGPR